MKPFEILHHHNLKRTSCREGIIGVILEAGQPLSEPEIRERLSGHYDRTTFYRSFRTLESHHILHRISVDQHLVKYAVLATPEASVNHAHFWCCQCNAIRCLDSVPLTEPPLPEGYVSNEAEMMIKGLCRNCKSAR